MKLMRDLKGSKPKEEGSPVKVEWNPLVYLHDRYDDMIHPVNLKRVCYANRVQGGDKYYTQLIFDRETWLDVRETYEEIFGAFRSVLHANPDDAKPQGFIATARKD